MNYNELYRRKDRIRPKRTAEEKRNIMKIFLAGALAMVAGMAVMGIILMIL